jgi:hypothetical protein
MTAEAAFASQVSTATAAARKQRLELELAILKAQVGIHEPRSALDEK